MATTLPLDRIGVGIDTARYGHRVCFLRPDRRLAAKALTVMENHDGYQALRQQLEQLHQHHPQAHFYVRIDAAGQYAANLEHFLRSLRLPITLSVGEPKRNKDYQKVHFPKRTSDDTESEALARFAVVELPAASPAPPPALALVQQIAGCLQAQVKQTTRTINRLHNLLARVFPELATLTDNLAAHWVLHLLEHYPSAARIAHARLASIQKIPYLPAAKAQPLQHAAQHSVASLRGELAETLVTDLVDQVRRCQNAEEKTRQLLIAAVAQLPPSGHQQVVTIPGIGPATAAVLIAKIADINRFATAEQLVGYFGVFPDEHTSGVDKQGRPLPAGTLSMSHQGSDLVRGYLWNAARTAITHNPAVRALYLRLRAKGKRGDVALGHCMRKLLHLVFAVWRTNRPFDEHHFPWQGPADRQVSAATPAAQPAPPASASDDKAVGHKRDMPAKQVVTTATSSVGGPSAPVNPPPRPATSARRRIDYAFVRRQVTLEQLLHHVGWFDRLHGSGLQRRGPCPLHDQAANHQHTFSVHLGKNVFQCFHAACAAHGNVLDFWAAYHRLPLYAAAVHLADTFHLPRNREEEPVK